MKITQSILNQEYSTVPIEVIESDNNFLGEFCSKYPELKNYSYMYRSGIYFSYCPGDGEDTLHKDFKPFIFIRKDIPAITKMWVFFHEKKHYLCDIKKCYCLNRGKRQEYHADCYALEECYQRGYKDSLSDMMWDISFGKSYHKDIIKSKKWQKYVNFVGCS